MEAFAISDGERPVSDEEINAYMAILEANSPPEILFGNSYLVTRIKTRIMLKDDKAMSKMCRGQRLDGVEIWVIPIYIETFHWLMCAIYIGSHAMFFYDPFSGPDDRLSSSAPEVAQVADCFRYFFGFYSTAIPGFDHFGTIPWIVCRPCFDPIQSDEVNCGVYAIVVAEIFRRYCHKWGKFCTREVPDVIRILNISEQRLYIKYSKWSDLESRGISWILIPSDLEIVIADSHIPRRIRALCDPTMGPERSRTMLTVQDKDWLAMTEVQSKGNVSSNFSVGRLKDALVYEPGSDPDRITSLSDWIERTIFDGVVSMTNATVRMTCYSTRNSPFILERLLLEMFARRSVSRVRLSIVMDLVGDLDRRCDGGEFLVHSEDYTRTDPFYTSRPPIESLIDRIRLNDCLYCLANSFCRDFLEIFVYRTGTDYMSFIESDESDIDILIRTNPSTNIDRDVTNFRIGSFSKSPVRAFVNVDWDNSEIQSIFPRPRWNLNDEFAVSNIDEISRLVFPLGPNDVALRKRYQSSNPHVHRTLRRP